MTGLVKPEFIVGDEKRFFEFISRFNEKDKIAIISHTDLDGLSAAKVINEVVNADLIKFINYEDLNDSLVNELKKEKIKKVIFSDLYFKNKEIIDYIEKFAEILIIDHHPITNDLNSIKTVFLNSEGFCASYLSYYLFSKAQNIEKWDWLVVCASLSDMCYKKNSEWMKEVYQKYDDKFEMAGLFVRKNGFFWDLQYKLSIYLIYSNDRLNEAYENIVSNYREIKKLEEIYLIVVKEIDDNISRFEKEKIDIKDGYFWEVKPKFAIKSILINDISAKYPNKTLIIGKNSKDLYRISSRRQDGKVDMNKLLNDLIKGFENASAGGHFKASGGHVQIKDADEFKKRAISLS